MKTYKYTIELANEEWPRYLADQMTMQPYFSKSLMSVQDLQRNNHWYKQEGKEQGDTFVVRSEKDRGKELEEAFQLTVGIHFTERHLKYVTTVQDLLSLLEYWGSVLESESYKLHQWAREGKVITFADAVEGFCLTVHCYRTALKLRKQGYLPSSINWEEVE